MDSPLRSDDPSDKRPADGLSAIIDGEHRLVAAMRLERRGHVRHAARLFGDLVAGGDERVAARAAQRLGGLLHDLGETAQGDDMLAHAATLATTHGRWDVLLDLGARRAAFGYTEAAAAIYTVVLARAGEQRHHTALAAYRLAHLHLAERRHDDALALMRRAAVDANSDLRPYALRELIDLLITADDHDDLRALLAQLVATDHPDLAPEAGLMLADREAAAGNTDAARRLYDLVIACEHPEHAPTALRRRSELLRDRVITAVRTRLVNFDRFVIDFSDEAPAKRADELKECLQCQIEADSRRGFEEAAFAEAFDRASAYLGSLAHRTRNRRAREVDVITTLSSSAASLSSADSWQRVLRYQLIHSLARQHAEHQGIVWGAYRSGKSHTLSVLFEAKRYDEPTHVLFDANVLAHRFADYMRFAEIASRDRQCRPLSGGLLTRLRSGILGQGANAAFGVRSDPFLTRSRFWDRTEKRKRPAAPVERSPWNALLATGPPLAESMQRTRERIGRSRQALARLGETLPRRPNAFPGTDPRRGELTTTGWAVQALMGASGNGHGLLAVHVHRSMLSLWLRDGLEAADGGPSALRDCISLSDRDPGVLQWRAYETALRRALDCDDDVSSDGLCGDRFCVH